MARHPSLAVGLAVAAVAACSSGGSHAARPATALVPTTAVPTAAAAPSAPLATATPSAGLTSPLAALRTSAARTTAAPTVRRTAGSSPTPSTRATSRPSPSPSALPAGTTVDVAQVTGDRFSPSMLTLHVGDSVLVTDQDSVAPHTFTISALGVDSGGMSQGQTFRYRFTSPGHYTFVCTYHQAYGMTGTLTVVA